MQIWYVEKQTSFTVKQLNTVIDTHTQLQSLHSQSQIRWQIRRLILLGGRGIGVPPLLQVVPQDTYTPLTHTSLRGATAARTNTSHRCPKTPPPIQVPAFSFTLSLHHRSLAPSLPPSLSISPPSLSSLTANQTGGDIIVLQPVQRQDYECVCVMGEKRGERDTHKDTPGILTGLCPCQTS